MRTERYSPKRDHARGRVSPLQSPEHPMGHANKRAQQQHHWRFGHSPRMPGHCTQRVGQHSVSGLMSRDSITYDANKRLEGEGVILLVQVVLAIAEQMPISWVCNPAEITVLAHGRAESGEEHSELR